MNRVWGFVLGFSLPCLSTGLAIAEPEIDESTPTYEPKYLDYRYQLLASDVVAVGLYVGFLAVPGSRAQVGLGIGSLAAYALAPPVIHLANEQPARSLASLGLRVGLPIAGAPLGIIAGGLGCAVSGSTNCGSLLVLFVVGGVLAGGVTAVVVDDGFLGKVELPRTSARPQLTRLSYRVTALPILDPKRKSLGMSLAGTF